MTRFVKVSELRFLRAVLLVFSLLAVQRPLLLSYLLMTYSFTCLVQRSHGVHGGYEGHDKKECA